MYRSILAGFMISLGAAAYLLVGGVTGAVLFSLGLLTILYFKLSLFTGQAGRFIDQEIGIFELGKIWIGNAVGCWVGACVMEFAGVMEKLQEGASAIIATRVENGILENFALGVICGVLMYVAVKYYERWPIATIMSVAAFILMGANHCVADMCYALYGWDWSRALAMCVALLSTTCGNFVGCNLIGGVLKYE